MRGFGTRKSFMEARSRRDAEQGAIAILLAFVTAFVMVPLAGLTLDIGMQRVARRDMQAVADIAALDTARNLGSGSATQSALTALATSSAARSSGTTGSTPVLHAYPGYVSSGAAFISDQSLGCNGGSPYNGYFTAVPTGVTPNAVLVTSSSSVNYAIHGGSGAVCRSSIASTANTACFKLGSYAATVKSGDSTILSPLNDIFGANLSLLSYQGIANANVTLAQLAANVRFGTASSLLTGSITVQNLVLATIDALSASAGGNTAAVSALNSLLSSTVNLPAIKLTNLLRIDPNDQAALNTQLNALDLIAGSVLVADGKHAVSIPNLWAGVAGTGHTADTGLYIQQGASTACGVPNSAQAQADNSQVNGYVKFDQMNSPSINLGRGDNLKTAVATGQLNVALAPAHGALVSPPSVHCGANTTADPTTYSVDVSSALASLGLSIQLPVSGSVTILGLGVVNLNLIVDVNVATTKPPSDGVANLSIPPNDTTPISTGSSVRLDSATTALSIDPSSTATLLGVPLSLVNALLVPTLNSVLGAVSSVFVPKTVTPLVANINSMLMGPLASLLGLDVGGADVYAIGATCNVPRLVG